MFCLNHRSIKVTLFSEIHIKIISKISLTYHQIAFGWNKIPMENLFGCNTLLPRINISGKKNEQNGKEQNRGKCIQFRFDSFAEFCVKHGGEGIDPGSFGKIGDGKIIQ